MEITGKSATLISLTRLLHLKLLTDLVSASDAR